jgi:hypothetical protein
MKEKNKSVKNIIEEIWHWICFALVVASVIYIVFKITINHIKRKHIENDPVVTEAVITEIGQGARYVGARIYYDYYVGDSLCHGNAVPGNKKVKQMKVGQTIKITYEKAHPSNSMYERCVSQ